MSRGQSEPTFRELMSCNTGKDERKWIDPEVEYEYLTTAPMIEVANIIFTEGGE